MEHDDRCNDAAEPVIARNAQAEDGAALQQQRPDGRKEQTQIHRRKPDGHAQKRENMRLIQPGKVESKHQHTGDGQQIERGA